MAKKALCALYKYSGAMQASETWNRCRGRTPMAIALFHRVCDEIPMDGITTSKSWFLDFCRLMCDRFHVVPLAEIYRILETGKNPPPRTVAITFDDCYANNLEAARLLAEHGLPATFFVPTDYVGTDRIFPWDSHLPRLANLSWDDVRAMVAMGHDIGSHTVTHADLGAIPATDVLWEMTESKRVLEQRLGRPCRHFAYPFGQRTNFRPEYLELALKAGYEGVVSGFGGLVRRGMQQTILPRDPVLSIRCMLNLELHLTGCLDTYYACKRRLGWIPT